MALTRSMLNGMGLTAEQISAIIEAHAETVDGLKAARDEYKAKADKAGELAAELDALKGDSTGAEWKAKYEKEAEAFNTFKADIKAKEDKVAKENAYKALLKESGVSEKRIDSILKVTTFDDLKLKEDGSIDGADDLKKTITTEWADFIETTDTKGADTDTPPAGNPGGADVISIPTLF